MDDEHQIYELGRYVRNLERHMAYVCSSIQPFQVEMLLQILMADDVLTPECFENVSKAEDTQKAKELFYNLVTLPTPIWCQSVLQTMRQMELNDVVDVVEGIKEAPLSCIFLPQVEMNPLFEISPSQSGKEATPVHKTQKVIEEAEPSSSGIKFHSRNENTSSSDETESGSPKKVLKPDINDVAGPSGDDHVTVNGSQPANGEVLNLRNYQLELAEPALKGNNCVIVAPTGTGKTFVALHICLQHLRKKEGGKVVFLAHNGPLVQQQFQQFKRHVAPQGFSVQQISGSTTATTPAVKIIQCTQVLVMTHQILINALQEEGGISMTAISLLIFDECHNAMKNHPYNDVMRVYLRQKMEGVEWVLPQIVGLTASTGSGKSKTVEQASKHIFQLLANLDVMLPPVRVKRNIEELQEFTTHDNLMTVPVERDISREFSVTVISIMKTIESRIQNLIERNENVLGDKVHFDVPGRHGRPDYENGVVEFRNESDLIEDAKLSQDLRIYANHLQIYNNALLINEHVREMDAIYYMEENLFKTEHALEVKLKQLYEQSRLPQIATNEPSVLLQNLIEIIKEHFSELPESRCIIFARTRDIAKLLVDCIEEAECLSNLDLNPSCLTGAGAKKSEGGLTKVLQDECVKKFREGKHKILIATSIADEGIDIRACNLVITYNHCSNEIALVQRKGRGRAKDSKMIVLAYSDLDFIQKESINQDRDQLTKQALDYIDSMDVSEVGEKIKELQSKSVGASPAKVPERVEQRDGKVWDLLCGHCKKKVTTSDTFRKIKQHFVTVDTEFPSKCQMPKMKAISVKLEVVITGKLLCGNPDCRQDWGSRMIYNSMEVYVLSIKNFVLKHGNEMVRKKKWKEALTLFTVDKNFDDDILADEKADDNNDEENIDIYDFSFD